MFCNHPSSLGSQVDPVLEEAYQRVHIIVKSIIPEVLQSTEYVFIFSTLGQLSEESSFIDVPQ